MVRRRYLGIPYYRRVISIKEPRGVMFLIIEALPGLVEPLVDPIKKPEKNR